MDQQTMQRILHGHLQKGSLCLSFRGFKGRAFCEDWSNRGRSWQRNSRLAGLLALLARTILGLPSVGNCAAVQEDLSGKVFVAVGSRSTIFLVMILKKKKPHIM
jgi:hypothetical protein